jgi:hypothetical protein
MMVMEKLIVKILTVLTQSWVIVNQYFVILQPMLGAILQIIQHVKEAVQFAYLIQIIDTAAKLTVRSAQEIVQFAREKEKHTLA